MSVCFHSYCASCASVPAHQHPPLPEFQLTARGPAAGRLGCGLDTVCVPQKAPGVKGLVPVQWRWEGVWTRKRRGLVGGP